MSKIAIIVQRYGKEVNGGAELHSKILAEKLKKQHRVTILTTKAIDYMSWDNHYTNDIEEINDIEVKRFKTLIPRNNKLSGKYRRRILKERKHHITLKKYGIFNVLNKKGLLDPKEKTNYNWLKNQGPYCPALIKYLKNNKDNYDCFIFFTYLYYPTVEGLKIVGDKSIFIPTAHDEPELYASVYKSTFKNAKFVMYNTLSEKKLVHKIFKEVSKNDNIAGVGIEKSYIEEGSIIPEEFNFDFDYVLYMGRIDPAKGCNELYQHFEHFKLKNPLSKLKLVFLGQKFTELPPKEDILFTGYVEEQVKQQLLKNCKALIIPSYYESLSMVTLEAMLENKIVIANGNCEVLKDHIQQSSSGYYYHNQDELCNVLERLSHLNESEIKAHGRKANEYVTEHYTWSKIIKKFDYAIDLISSQQNKKQL